MSKKYKYVIQGYRDGVAPCRECHRQTLIAHSWYDEGYSNDLAEAEKIAKKIKRNFVSLRIVEVTIELDGDKSELD